jgi:hypothetical protein
MLKDAHRWALLLKQQSLITIYRLPTKENKHLVSVFPFAANGGKFAGSVFCLQETYGNWFGISLSTFIMVKGLCSTLY